MKNILFVAAVALIILGAGYTPAPAQLPARESKIPADAVKMAPATDPSPPKSLTREYSDPVPVAGKVNTAGAEDSAFVMPDGQTLYFFFTPDVRVPVEKQVADGVTGIYVSHKAGDEWGEAQRILLQKPGKLAGDGCEFVQGDTMWFCTVREGYTGMHWFTAKLKDGTWQDWKNADFDPDYKVGELHITKDGNELYFHSDRSGGKGGLDIWVSKKADGKWQEPENVTAVNTDKDEGWPDITPDGNELWFYRDFGAWRSKKIDGRWQTPQQMFSPLAGEPSVDSAGNVYFTHHFFKDNRMLEADIYVARKNAVPPETKAPTPTLDFSLGVCDSNIDPYSQPPAGILKQTWLDQNTLQVEGFLKTYCGGAKITGDLKTKNSALDLYFKITTDGPVTSCKCAHKLIYEISNLKKQEYAISLSEKK